MQKIRELIKPVVLDSNGVFKYIQILIKHKLPGPDTEDTVIIRGSVDCEYHADVLQKFDAMEFGQDASLQGSFKLSCPGGGRVEVNEAAKTLVFYGYSQGFGRANHAQTKEIVEKSGLY